MEFIIQKAVREQLPIKALLSGSSGSGKTYSSLILAKGITNKSGGTIYLGNTEGPRGKLYADEFDYELIDFDAPRSTERYIALIKQVESIAPKGSVLIIDSLSHEWTYLNELVNKMPGNSFQNWGKVKPIHQKMVDTIVESPLHIIATGRGKDEYVMETNNNNKQQPKKVGVGIQQDKDAEYEYIVTFNIAQDTHVASVMKDNTHLFEGRFDVLKVSDGEALYNWANSGSESPKELQQRVIELAKELGGSANPEVKDAVESNTGCLRPTDCTDTGRLNKAIQALEKMKNERK